jgi:hypothetical protein
LEKNRPKYKRNAYGRIEKTGEGFVIRGKEWTQTQEVWLWEGREEWRKLCYKRERVDTDTRGVLMGRGKFRRLYHRMIHNGSSTDL